MAKGFCDSMTDDVFEEKLEGADILNTKQNILAQGILSGRNIDKVGTSDGVPIGLAWLHVTENGGTQPYDSSHAGDLYYFLLTLQIFDGTQELSLQIAIPFSYSYLMAIRCYVNGSWSIWKTLIGT